ncbi:MAG: sulfate adenylyltransferase subunit CysN [Rhodospirillales bacterium]
MKPKAANKRSNIINLKKFIGIEEEKSQLRFITCGSVDDGKSTLIGRLLYDANHIFDDQLEALEADSRKIGTQGGAMDFALLVDGLSAEREQGITIDVAYRYFATEKRKFIVADTPGHEQYTRNMATGASTADLAVILIDARKGVMTQTRRHSFIISQLNVQHTILAVNKMDLVDFSKDVFDSIVRDFSVFATKLDLDNLSFIPISALGGDNIYSQSEKTDWYQGPTLTHLLETAAVESRAHLAPFRFPVQWVNRSSSDFRGFSGTIISGKIAKGDSVVVLPSGATSKVKNIVTYDNDLDSAIVGQAVTLVLEDEIDISRGDVLSQTIDRPEVTDQLLAHLLWMAGKPMLSGRPYMLKVNNKSVSATVTDIKYKIDVNTLGHEATKTLSMNELGVCNLFLDEKIAFEPYTKTKEMGSFILIDVLTNDTVAMGLIDYGLRRADNIQWQNFNINKQARARLKNQNPAVLWFTGLSGSGKTTIANIVEQRLYARHNHTVLLDGDNIRHGLSKDLGFTDADRVENIRRIAETSKLMVDAGLMVLVSFISPFAAERRFARNLLEEREFIEIFIDASVELCASRDPKGLYKKVEDGEIKNFTGIDSPYESPEEADITIDSAKIEAVKAADQIMQYLEINGYLANLD